MKHLAFTVLMIGTTLSPFAQHAHQSLDSLFKTYYHKDEPGAAVVIESKGEIIFKAAYGLADMASSSPVNAQSNYNIGSITKQFTAYSILKLASEKRLSLDDKLIRFFPDIHPTVGNQISVQQLLTHSSGILDHYAFTDTSKVKHATDKDVFQAVRGLDHTYFKPGTQYRYSNTAYCLLGLIIEKISGQPYADYIRKNILLPLNMKNSQILSLGHPILHQVTGYDTIGITGHFRKLDAAESIFFSTEGDGGMYTSLDDYLLWFHGLQEGKRLNPEIIKLARSAHVEIDPKNKLSYGYGWFISEKDPDKAVYHTGSNGGFRAIVFTIPSIDYAVIIFSNRTDIDLEIVAQQINSILHIGNKSFTKIDSLVSFIDCWPNFAPCKEIPSFSTLFKKNWSANAMALN